MACEMGKPVITVTIYLFFLGICKCSKIYTDIHDKELKVGETCEVTLNSDSSQDRGYANITLSHNVVSIEPSTIDFMKPPPWKFKMKGLNPGHDVVIIKPSDGNINSLQAFIRTTVMLSKELQSASIVIGWIYFAAWSVSFYPQIYDNWKRKSVVGLNFDFVYLNLIGFTLYSIFNCGLYWIPEIENEYFKAHPRGLNPIMLNDIVFSVHAALVTIFTIIQCFIYDSGDQRVSSMAKGIMGIFFIIFVISFILPFCNAINWLTFLYVCSYIKLTITLIKYVPQAYMNYNRKSTVGWSIGNVLLDFTGGTLSILQMLLNAYNYDDWNSIFGDVTKFGLGLFSVLFDILFLVQHYVLYRDVSYEELQDVVRQDATEPQLDE